MKTTLKKRKRLTEIMMSLLTAAALCVLGYAAAADAAGIEQRILNSWTKSGNYSESDGTQSLSMRVTYYSAEYIEALVRAEAEKNLWTQDEEDSYKYNLLKVLNLDESIAFHFDFDVAGVPAYLQPFDRHLKLYAGRAVLEPSDYDKRFNFKLQGKRDGMVWFPRYDDKTGKDLLDGLKEIRLQVSGAISHATTKVGNILLVWDITGDDPSVLRSGSAAARLELDRLIKRLDRLKADQRALEEQLRAVNNEVAEVDSRVDELQRQ